MVITHTYRVKGVVQGVGFRPFVSQLAEAYELTGYVLNDSLGVSFCVQGTQTSLDLFLDSFYRRLPPLAQVDSMKLISSKTDKVFGQFEIRRSQKNSDTGTLIPVDAVICDTCLQDITDPNNRRFQYPFTNCTHCGPRYSLIQDMPYDRSQTTMHAFEMCEACRTEYEDVRDRRYHAQPNACPDCGPEVWVTDQTGAKIEAADPIAYAKSLLRAGKILAVKGIGGFQLAVNAADPEAVRRLRKLKKRDSKPFALMMHTLETVERFALLDDRDRAALKDVANPIVIVRKKPGTLPDEVAPHNPSYGVMLATSPMHHLLLADEDLDALVMTSGNISGRPIEFRNEDAVARLSKVADAFLLHNRDINIPIDDSIVRNVPTSLPAGNFSIVMRSARGFAPRPVPSRRRLLPILALGGEMKSAVAISKQDYAFLGQHTGDLKNKESFDSHQLFARHLANLLEVEPRFMACDLHPQFHTSIKAQSFADGEIPIHKVQHHHAHMASCMADNALIEPVIGVIFDGTGYGLDGTIWGGEILVGDYSGFQRVAHLKPFQLIGGDKAVLEPMRGAFALLHETFGDDAPEIAAKIGLPLPQEATSVFGKMIRGNLNTIQTTSMGRLFDAVSSLTDTCHKIEYEAQAAIELEGLLQNDHGKTAGYEFALEQTDDMWVIDYRSAIRAIVEDRLSGTVSAAEISRKFHSGLSTCVARLCRQLSDQFRIMDVAMSGGVFMNGFLLKNTAEQIVGRGLEAFVHKNLPANDGGLALGQLMVADAHFRKLGYDL